jgi:hypothetical protein
MEAEMLKTVLIATIAVGAALSGVSAASAEGGCGPGFHRTPYGHCRPNFGPGPGPAVIIGGFYPGRGWWDGHRYWAHRDHWHGGWRYR